MTRTSDPEAKEDKAHMRKAVYAKPRLTRLGLLRKITGFSF